MSWLGRRRRAALPPLPAPPSPAADAVWPPVADQFALRLIGLTERLLPIVNDLESTDVDETTMQCYYQIDHIGAQARRLARELRILAGVSEGEIGGEDASLLEVIRWAASSVEQYTRLTIRPGPEIAVAAHASDDVAALLAALLDNATRFSPSNVRVSSHEMYGHSVIVRIEDDGFRFDPEHLGALNRALAGPVPPIDERTGQHTGFPVVHRVAHRHGIGVQLQDREPWGESTPAGTIALVTLPPHLLRRLPTAVSAAAPSPRSASVPPLLPARGQDGTAPLASAGPDRPPATGTPAASEGRTAGGLPIRVRGSLTQTRRPLPDRTSREDPAAGARAFLEDLTAFGGGDVTGPPPHSGGSDHGKQV